MPFLLSLVLALGQSAPPPNSYLKTTTESNGIFSLQTGAHRLVAAGKPDVWLVGAAHIGTKAYYSGIQSLLDAQGEVLFEGVKAKARTASAPKAPPTTTPKPGETAKPIYLVLSDAMGLDFQLNDINYRHTNWIDSDLSMDELESLNKSAAGGKTTEFNKIEQLLDPHSPMAQQFAKAIDMMTPGTLEGLKLFLVQKLSTLDPASVLGDAATQQVVLKARNKSVEGYFAKAVASPKPPRSIAIFYGALHQQDIERDLAAQYGYRVAETRWFTAATADTKKLDAQGHAIYDILNSQYSAAAATAKQ